MGIPGFEKLPLECALDDPPQMRTLATVFCEDVTCQHVYLAKMHNLTSKLVTCLDDVTLAYQGLAHHLHAYSSKKYAINTDPKNLIDTSLSKSAELMQEVSTWQHILCTQLTDGVLHPLTQQLNAYSQLQQLKEKHAQCSQALEVAVGSFLRVKKRDSEAEKEAAAAALTDARQNFHQCAVMYYNELNLHQVGLWGGRVAGRPSSQLPDAAAVVGCCSSVSSRPRSRRS
ncbi:Arfaptin (AH) domain/BAR domain [Trinorchestia longiramus]|nr:Arfaptin (AH) domain/BAR domain [Trinorchestia longiramus]